MSLVFSEDHGTIESKKRIDKVIEVKVTEKCLFRRIRTPIPGFSYTPVGVGGCIATDAGANAVLVVHLLWNYRRTVGLNVGYMAIDNCYFA